MIATYANKLRAYANIDANYVNDLSVFFVSDELCKLSEGK